MTKILRTKDYSHRSFVKRLLMITKLITFLLLINLSTVSAGGFAQTVTLRANNITLLNAMKTIKKQTGHPFFLKGKDLAEIRKNVDINQLPLKDALDKLLSDLPAKWVMEEGTIVIKPVAFVGQDASNKDFVKAMELSIPPDKIITGRVVDVQGNPLPNVSVVVAGTSIGTTTNNDGRFTINAPDNKNVSLVFSSVGFIAKKLPLASQTNVNVVLEAANTGLDEVVVTALGIKRETKVITYSTQTVSGNDMNVAKEVNPINSLKGQVAGITITNIGDGISSRPKVLLRGSRSITGNNEPLYVTDGVPGNTGLLDPANIESITVLKGASAAAMYGSAGQNGAIIITTKTGKAGKINIGYNGGMTFDKALMLSDFQYEYGQGDQGIFYPTSDNSWGPKATGQMVTLWNGKEVPLIGQKNRFNEFYQVGKTINNSISISGGSDKMQTFFSYGNTIVDGILRNNNNLNRNVVNLKIHNNISEKLSFGADITYNLEDMSVSSQYPYSSVYLVPVTIPMSEMKEYRYVDEKGVIRQNFWKPNTLGSNPYFTMNGDLVLTKQSRVRGLVFGKYKFTDWLDVLIRANVGVSSMKNEQKKYAGISTVQSVWGPDYYHTTSAGRSSYVDALVSFNKDVAKDLTISGNLGASVSKGRSEGTNFHANGLYKDDFFYFDNAKAPVSTSTERRTPEVQGVYALATVAYRNYLFVDVTGRNDWSSALPKSHESYFYPSAGVSVVLSEMVKMPSWVSFGKARVSLAKSGYGGVEYLSKNYYTVGLGGVIITPTIQSLGDYKPELTSSFEAGMDWRFLDNRLGFNITYYNTETKNQLLLIGAPSASLFDQRYINAGLIRNRGVELTANLTPVKSRVFSWNIIYNFSRNYNKVLKLTDDIKSVVISGGGGSSSAATIKVVEGDSYGDIYVKGWQRDSQGRKLVNDLGVPLLTGGQDVNVGNYNPDYMMGMTNTFSYKNLSMQMLIDYRKGGHVISASQALLDGRGLTKATLEGREDGIILDAYTTAGAKNSKAISPQSYFSSIGDIYLTGEFYDYSATNMRLRELIVTYKFPQKLFKGGIVKGAEFALVGRNLFYFIRKAPFDPEIGSVGGNSGGQEFGYIPSTRNMGFNIKLTL